MAHWPARIPSVEMERPPRVPSGPAVRLYRASVALPSGAVNHETISSPGRKPRIMTCSGVPGAADGGVMVASIEGGKLGAPATWATGEGSGPPYSQR